MTASKKEYWTGIVEKLKTDCNWATHVLSTCIEEDESNLKTALKFIEAEKIIEGTIYAFNDWSAQPYCDERLEKFEKNQVKEVFQKIENPTDNMLKGIEGFI